MSTPAARAGCTATERGGRAAGDEVRPTVVGGDDSSAGDSDEPGLGAGTTGGATAGGGTGLKTGSKWANPKPKATSTTRRIPRAMFSDGGASTIVTRTPLPSLDYGRMELPLHPAPQPANFIQELNHFKTGLKPRSKSPKRRSATQGLPCYCDGWKRPRWIGALSTLGSTLPTTGVPIWAARFPW
jgi:hypothetical protein